MSAGCDSERRPSECWVCGFPLSAHGGLPIGWQERMVEEWPQLVAMSDNGFEVLERAARYMPRSWMDHCQRLLEAEVSLGREERRQRAYEAREAREAEAANRAWEAGLRRRTVKKKRDERR